MGLRKGDGEINQHDDCVSEEFEGDSAVSNESQDSQEQIPGKSMRTLLVLAAVLLLFLLAALFFDGSGVGFPCH